MKYKEVYLHAYDTVSTARARPTRYFRFCNARRPHTALDRATPDAVYVNRSCLRRQLKPQDLA